MSLKTAENGKFWAQMGSFDWFLNQKCDLKKFWVDLISQSAISHVFASFNFAKMVKISKIAKFNLAKINPIKVFHIELIQS